MQTYKFSKKEPTMFTTHKFTVFEDELDFGAPEGNSNACEPGVGEGPNCGGGGSESLNKGHSAKTTAEYNSKLDEIANNAVKDIPNGNGQPMTKVINDIMSSGDMGYNAPKNEEKRNADKVAEEEWKKKVSDLKKTLPKMSKEQKRTPEGQAIIKEYNSKANDLLIEQQQATWHASNAQDKVEADALYKAIANKLIKEKGYSKW